MTYDDEQRLIEELHKARNEKNKIKECNILLELGSSYLKKNNISKAKLNFEEALNLEIEIPYLYYHLGLVNVKEEQFEEAKKYLRKEIKIFGTQDAKFLLEKIKIHRRFPVMTLSIVFLCLLVFLFTYPTLTYSDALRFGLVKSSFILSSLFSSIFVHMNIFHFVVNIFALLAFGLVTEKLVGSLRFVVVFLGGALSGNFFESILGAGDIVVGASAGIFAILGMLVMREPTFKVKLLGIVEIPLYFAIPLFFVLLSIFSPLSILSNSSSGDFAHLFGLLTGVILTGLMYAYSLRMFYMWLLFSFGFWLFFYSLTLFFSNFASYDLLLNVFYVIMSIMGLLFVVYSYSLIKDLEVEP